MFRDWIKLTEALTEEPLDEKKKHHKKKKKHHHHTSHAHSYGYPYGGVGLYRGVFACLGCGSHIPQQHVGDNCPVCTAPVADSGGGGDTGGGGDSA